LSYILDASVYVPLIATIGTRLLKIIKEINFIILDLTIYETCNAFWKSWTKLHKISKEEAIKACRMAQFIANKLKLYHYEDLDFEKVIEIAIDNNITVYDAAYITLGLMLNIPIASEDEDIKQVAPKYNVKVIGLNELLKIM